MSKYYVSGCKGLNDDIVTCDDSEAEFWTIYERFADGTSQGIIDLKFREDAESAMQVYADRDGLQQKLNAMSHECGMMMGLLNDICRYHEECTHDDMMHALIPLEYVSAINSYVGRDVDGENPCPITDAYLNSVRADGIEAWIESRNGAWNGTTEQAKNFAAQLRTAGQADKDGDHV